MSRSKLIYLTLLTLCLLGFSLSANAQRAALSVNVGDALLFGSVGTSASYALSRHWTLEASGRWNPWTFHKGQDNQWQLRHQTYAVGARWWPWHVFSGWYITTTAQYQEYSFGGLFRSETSEGDAWGASLGVGYMYMLSTRWNINFGLAGWAGVRKFNRYACPHCGRKIESGTEGFILPNELTLGLTYVF